MKLIAFSVHDSKAAAFLSPFFTPTVAMGVRAFAQAANDPSTMFARHAGDYTLFQIGTFDQETGTLTPDKAQTNHGLAITHRMDPLENEEAMPTITRLQPPTDRAADPAATSAEGAITK